jgi:hypothetical protein
MKTEKTIEMLREVLKSVTDPSMKKDIENKIKALTDNKDVVK